MHCSHIVINFSFFSFIPFLLIFRIRIVAYMTVKTDKSVKLLILMLSIDMRC